MVTSVPMAAAPGAGDTGAARGVDGVEGKPPEAYVQNGVEGKPAEAYVQNGATAPSRMTNAMQGTACAEAVGNNEA